MSIMMMNMIMMMMMMMIVMMMMMMMVMMVVMMMMMMITTCVSTRQHPNTPDPSENVHHKITHQMPQPQALKPHHPTTVDAPKAWKSVPLSFDAAP